jgi:hypothetical protein
MFTNLAIRWVSDVLGKACLDAQWSCHYAIGTFGNARQMVSSLEQLR